MSDEIRKIELNSRKEQKMILEEQAKELVNLCSEAGKLMNEYKNIFGNVD